MDTSLTNIEHPRSAWWCLNGHVHTIARSLLSNPEPPACEHIEIPTPDDDFLEIEVHDAGPGRPAIALFHGLEGSSRRYYIIELMQAFQKVNFSVVAVNFRGCGSRMNRRRRFYHSGQTQDLATVFHWINKRFKGAPLGAVGFSLGGNALLKSLGELGNDHPLQAAVAVSVPYNLREGSLNIGRGANHIYQYYFLNSLTQKLEQKKQTYPDLPHFDGHTLYDFDHQVTAPLHDFDSADDYYAQCSSDQFLSDIGRPTLLVHSRQDPICNVDCMPMDTVRSNPNLDYAITDNGGHVGFWHQPEGWLNTTITNYFMHIFDL